MRIQVATMATILHLPLKALQIVLGYCTLDDLVGLARTYSCLARLISQVFISSRAFQEPRFSCQYPLVATISSPSILKLYSASIILRFNSPEYSGRLQSDIFYQAIMQISPSVEGFLYGLPSKLLSWLPNKYRLILFRSSPSIVKCNINISYYYLIKYELLSPQLLIPKENS